MAKISLAGIVSELKAAGSFLVTSHSNPDGDAIGSMLGVYHLLHALGKTRVCCMSDGPVPRVYQWLAGADQIVQPGPVPYPADLVIVVDVSRMDRLGATAEHVPSGARVIVIDHHLENNPDGDFVYLDSGSSAAGECIALLYQEAGIVLSRDAAECLYVSIATDTGGFRFANTTPNAHRIAAGLIESGIDVSDITGRVFDFMSMPKFELLRRVLQRMQFEMCGRLAYAVITAKDMGEARARNEDADGLVNYLRNIEGVEVGVLFREVDAATSKVSVRSGDAFNAAQFLGQFGGGGHARAAGATVALPLTTACMQIIGRMRQQMGEAA